MSTEAKDLIMDQIIVAFGSGAGAVRVERAALARLRAHYFPKITDDLIERWEEVSAQALERIRVVGRRAASNMVGDARTSINEANVSESIFQVEAASETPLCQ